nr:retrovirus-related Pol polyprotein from transposon TNT 1-94 [Tanacetum cinerariifolium]
MAEDGKLKIDSMMVMISVSVRCRSKTLYIRRRRSFRSLWQNPNLQVRRLCCYYLRSPRVGQALLHQGQIQGRGNDRGQEAESRTETSRNHSLKLVASRGKEVNMARDSDDALVCCVENMVEDRIMDFGASFHATYCKEKLERFKLRSGKCQRLGDMSKIGMNMLASKSNIQDVRKDPATMILLSKTTPGVAVGLRILEEEWRGKDTSLAQLKVFGCDSFVKVKDVCGEAMKCTFIGSGSDEMRYSFRDTKSHQLDIPENLVENDSIVADHGLSSKITQSLGKSSDTSEGSENSRSFEDSGRSDEEYSEDGASCKEGGSETPQVKENQEKDKIGSKPDKNGKRGEAQEVSKAISVNKARKTKKIQVKGPKMQIPMKLYGKKKR